MWGSDYSLKRLKIPEERNSNCDISKGMKTRVGEFSAAGNQTEQADVTVTLHI
jgi:hypothetical protein